jgi:hypothetical protein
MSGFDKTSSTRNPATQHPDSMTTEPVPILWEEVHLTHRRASALRSHYVTEWLKQTFMSWRSVFRRPGHMIPERHDRLQTR